MALLYAKTNAETQHATSLLRAVYILREVHILMCTFGSVLEKSAAPLAVRDASEVCVIHQALRYGVCGLTVYIHDCHG